MARREVYMSVDVEADGEGRDPAEAMNAASAWVTDAAAGATPIVVAYPLGYDWMWRRTRTHPFERAPHAH